MDERSVNHLSVINRSKVKMARSERVLFAVTVAYERKRKRESERAKDRREKENGYYFTEQISIPFDDLP